MIKVRLQKTIEIITKNDSGRFIILIIKLKNFGGMFEYLNQYTVKELGTHELLWTTVIMLALFRENINFKFVNNY